MNVWLATGPSREFFRCIKEGGHPFYLGAHPMNDRSMEMLTPHQFSFFLDSGAYSAWSRNSGIDLDEYIAFIKANIEHIEVYASLDVIPGKPGQSATTQQRTEAAEQSWLNYLYMVRDGLDPIPVFHYGEDFKFLERMLDYGCPYIGIGGLVGIPAVHRAAWLDRVFTRLTNSDGHPIVKTHGFGMTAIPLIFRYPWYSVDSTTWIQVTANGAVYLPQHVDGEFVFDRIPNMVTVSSTNPRQNAGGKAANTMSSGARAVLDKWLAMCGKTYDEVCSHYTHRAIVNVMFFKLVSERKKKVPFQLKTARRVGMC